VPVIPICTKVFLTQPVILQRDKRLSLGLQFENKDLRDQMKVVGTSSTKSIKLVTASVDGTVYDTILGGGVTRAMLAVKFGDLSLDSANDRITDNLSAKTAGHFKTLSLTLLRLQRLNDQWSLYANIQGQLSDKNLSSSEKLSLGGAYGVRAYPQGEAVGDIGVLGNLELRYQINPMWQTLAFVDAGTVRINKSRWDNTGTNHRSLSAAGIGAKMQIRGLTLDATLAYRLSSSEKAVSDNSDDSYRFWLRSMWQF
jgi:hemolysin activation/secretion protein